MWQGLQQITQYKQKPTPAKNDPTLPDQLNHLYSRFDRKNTTKAVPSDWDSGLPPPPFTVQPWEVKILFTKLNIRKAAGPDNISPCTINIEVLCRTTCPNILWNPQPLPQPVQSPSLLQVIHHHSSSPKKQSLIPERLSTCCPYIHCHEGVWALGAALPEDSYRLSARPTSVRLQSKQVNGRHSMPRSTPCSQIPRLPQHLCTNTLHRLQFGVQHNHTT